MEVKEAVHTAKGWLANVMSDEDIINVGLEEVKFDEEKNMWLVTLGFSRPWNSVRNALTAISGEPATKRVYRVISVDDKGLVHGMERRQEIPDQ